MGFTKKWFRTGKHLKLDEERAAKGLNNDRERFATREKDEGDLFGVRALEAGFFGGVAQSRPSSPTPSYVLSPSTTIVNWGDRGTLGSLSASSSTTDLPGTSIAGPKTATTKPSPLRLEASESDLRGRVSSAANVGGIGGTYMPPLPSSRSLRSDSPAMGASTGGWVSPLDVHFSRPTTPAGPPRPISFLPKLNFPDTSKTALFVPTPSGSLGGLQSEVASIVGSEISTTSRKVVEAPAPYVPITQRGRPKLPGTQTDYASSRPGSSARSIIPTGSAEDKSEPTLSNPTVEGNKSPTPPLPSTPSFPLPVDPDLFPEDDRPWDNSNKDKAVIRDSLVTKKSVSVYQPPAPGETIPGVNAHNSVNSIAASSMYSINTEVPELPKELQGHSRTRSRSASTTQQSRSRSRSTSTSASHSRASSTHSLARTKDSVRRKFRKSSQEREHRHSRDRDQIHFDPSSHRRNRSGSVQGRAVDFDHPRESPFSNSNAASTHSTSSSTSSFESAVQKQGKDTAPKQQPGLAVSSVADAERLSVIQSFNRGRSTSEVSQNSIGDFYDSYYRQSIVAQRVSTFSQNKQPSQVSVVSQGPGPNDVRPALLRGSDGLLVSRNESGQWMGGMNMTADSNRPAAPRGPMNFNGPRGPPPRQGPNSMNGGRGPPARGPVNFNGLRGPVRQGGENGSNDGDFEGINLTMGRRAPPPPVGTLGLAGQTIQEMPSPATGSPVMDSDRFPSRI
ncbi:hypothetical protein G7Y89_g8606 [Cudoniella acicularis]|uniref:Uncharacterized protein n=1 Tax=Cudoniella acicularis TaxID=354080 RepID=A0A8H4RIU9_9HELO|nr:hypothetical protein G7Y89_g8606 [Cudoniella acicularis]